MLAHASFNGYIAYLSWIRLMRDPIRIFYYPDMLPDADTLKKAILFFDEIHVMDRPSFKFTKGFGTIGMASPMRQVEDSFRDGGVPLFVHDAPQNSPAFLAQVTSDGNDVAFLQAFQDGLKTSETFRSIQVARGQYPPHGDQDDIVRLITSFPIADALSRVGGDIPLLLENDRIPHFNLTTEAGALKHLIVSAMGCSAKMNVALNLGTSEGFVPLADAAPYSKLLSVKYARAMESAKATKPDQILTDLSFAIFNELVSQERLTGMGMKEVVEFRKASSSYREHFLEYLAGLNTKISSVDGSYDVEIEKIIVSEIIPAARAFKNKLSEISEKALGDVAKATAGSTIVSICGAGGFGIFGDLSWEKILVFAGGGLLATSGVAFKTAVDIAIGMRAAKRESAVSYLLSLDKG